MRRLFKSTILVAALSLPLLVQSGNEALATPEVTQLAGPFGRCGAKVYFLEDGDLYTGCIYHFFQCECLVIRG